MILLEPREHPTNQTIQKQCILSMGYIVFARSVLRGVLETEHSEAQPFN